MAVLDKRRTEVLHGAARTIQRHARGYLARKHFRQAVAAAVRLQAASRGMLARTIVRNMRRERAATLIQAYVRRWRQRQLFVRTVRAVLAVQAAFRGYQARQYVRDIKQHDAALLIQSNWKRHRAQAEYQRYRRGVVAAQVGAHTELQRRVAPSTHYIQTPACRSPDPLAQQAGKARAAVPTHRGTRGRQAPAGQEGAGGESQGAASAA